MVVVVVVVVLVLVVVVVGGGGGGCFSFGGTVQCIEESNIYLCFVVCRLKKKKREDWLLDRICESKKDCWDSIRRTSYPYQKVER